MAIINPYTNARENETEPVLIPRGKSIADFPISPGSPVRYAVDATDTLVQVQSVPPKFLAKRKKMADRSLGFAAKCKLAVVGSQWSSNGTQHLNVNGVAIGASTVTIDYVSGFGEALFVSYTDSDGNPTGYTAIGAFLSRFPVPVEVQRQTSKRVHTEPAEPTGERKRNAIDLGAIV